VPQVPIAEGNRVRLQPLPDMQQQAAPQGGIGDAIGEGAQRLGQAGEHYAVTEAERLQQVDRAALATQSFGVQQRLSERILALRDNAAAGAAGHVAAVRQAVQEETQPFVSSIGDPVLRSEFMQRMAAVGTSALTDEETWASHERLLDLTRTTKDAIDQGANGIMTTATPQNHQLTHDTINHTIDGLSSVPESTRHELRDYADEQLASAYIIGQGRDNPGGAVATLRSGLFDNALRPEQRRTLETEMLTRQRQAQSAARAVAQSQIDVFQARLRNHDPTITDADIAQMGQIAAAAGIPTEVFNLATARVMHQVDHDFQRSTPVEIRNAIGELNTRIGQAGDHASPDDVIRRNHLQTLLTQREAEMQHDPGALVEQRGLTIPPLDGTPQSVQARVTAMRAVQQQTGSLQFYRPQEAQVLRNRAATSPAGRLNVINEVAGIGRYDPQMAMAAAEQIAPGDATFRHAIRLDNPAARQLVVAGVDARRTLPNVTTLADGTNSTVDAATQRWFLINAAPALRSSQPEFVHDTLETARNIYAALRLQSGATGAEPFSEANFADAVNLALGRSSHGGGLGQWRGSMVLLPSNMSQQHFDALFSSLPGNNEQWPHGSINGVPVYPNGQTVSREALRTNYTPVAVGDGVYQFHHGNQVVMTRQGRPLEINMRMLQTGRHSLLIHGQGIVTDPRNNDSLPSPDPTMNRAQYRAAYGHEPPPVRR